MTEAQLKLFAPFKVLPIYDESDERSHAFVAREGMAVRECSRIEEVETCLADLTLIPLGAVRVRTLDPPVVIVYFARKG